MTKYNVEKSTKIANDFSNPFKFWLFQWTMLPPAAFMGIRVKSLTLQKAEISIKYGWRSRNPFKSMYFAAQCAAGELATGALCTAIGKGFDGNVLLLVKNMEAEFSKPAKGNIIFTCEEGDAIKATIQHAIETNQSKVHRATAIGTNETGEVVSKIYISWSFKYKP
jgi:Domain of unknown function (DUF4442)